MINRAATMPLLCGSALNTFPSASFPSQYKNATAKSSSIFAFQFSLPKLSSSSSSPSSYSIRTHFPSNSFGTTFHVRCRQQDSFMSPQEQEEDPRFRGLVENNPLPTLLSISFLQLFYSFYSILPFDQINSLVSGDPLQGIQLYTSKQNIKASEYW